MAFSYQRGTPVGPMGHPPPDYSRNPFEDRCVAGVFWLVVALLFSGVGVLGLGCGAWDVGLGVGGLVCGVPT